MKKKIRNIAIIAHIDHGKTTLVDALLQQSQIFRENQAIPTRAMDSYDQEQERGITIFAKPTSIDYEGTKINIIDTPGHADFSAEVERILGTVNSVLLVVDAKEGPMPQTRFVLSKSLKMGLKPIVVLNKIDRPHADPERVLNETFDLFVELSATDEQLDFSYCYASALEGYALNNVDDPKENLRPLLDLILRATPAPEGDAAAPFLIQATQVTYDDFLGRQACGRILNGSVKKGQYICHINAAGKSSRSQISRVEGFRGLEKIELDEAGVGDIVVLSGVPEIMIGDALCDPNNPTTLPPIHLEEPHVTVDLLVNDGPLVGKSGKHVTLNKLRDRLLRERRANISYKITEASNNEQKISLAGRGELHLAILLEAMRREGFEYCVSKPQVILKEIDGTVCEPVDRIYIEVPEEFSGVVIEQLSKKRGEMQNLQTNEQGISQIEFLIPTRGIMGYRNDFLTATRGLGIMTRIFESYEPHKGEIVGRSRGVLISMSSGKANAYALFNLQDRGELFSNAGDEVYEGMIVGEHSRDNDLIVNAIRGKQLTNVRASGTDESLSLSPPRKFTLEQAIGYINDDEWIEVTPDAIRLRKSILSEVERKRKKV